MTEINEKLKKLAPDLTTGYPRSPRATLAGYVIAARCVDKGRAVLAGINGEYHFDCPLDNLFLGFAEIKAADLKDFLATGADDAEVDAWITEHAKKREKIEIIKWNNDIRYKRISELPDRAQEYLETYIPQVVPSHLIPHIDYWFDVYDAEEKRFA